MRRADGSGVTSVLPWSGQGSMREMNGQSTLRLNVSMTQTDEFSALCGASSFWVSSSWASHCDWLNFKKLHVICHAQGPGAPRQLFRNARP